MTNNNKPTVQIRNTGVIAGIGKHIQSNVTIGGVVFTPADLKAVFETQNSAVAAGDALHKQWKDQLQVASVAGAKARRTFNFLRSYLVGLYGDQANAVFNDFGMSPPKAKSPPTVKAKSVAVDKRAATRAARHTVGKVQKKSVKGTAVASPPAQGTAASTAPTVQPPAPAAAGPAAAAPKGGA